MGAGGEGVDRGEVVSYGGEREMTVEQTACARLEEVACAGESCESRCSERFEDGVEELDGEVIESHGRSDLQKVDEGEGRIQRHL